MPGNIAKELFNFVNSPKHSKLLTFEECELLCTIKKKTFKYNCTNDMALPSYSHLPLPFQCTDTVLVTALILTSGGKGQVIHHRLRVDFSHSLSVSLEVSDPFSSSSEKSEKALVLLTPFPWHREIRVVLFSIGSVCVELSRSLLEAEYSATLSTSPLTSHTYRILSIRKLFSTELISYVNSLRLIKRLVHQKLTSIFNHSKNRG